MASFNIFDIKREYRLVILFILIFFCSILSFYSYSVEEIKALYVTFFFIPVALASVWWGYKGIIFSIILGLYMVLINIFMGLDYSLVLIPIRLFVFVLLTLLVSNATEILRKSESNLIKTNVNLKGESDRIKLRISEIENENIRLEEADRVKSIFLSSMSHELRTPLNSIIGFTGILLQGLAGELNDEQKKQLTMVKKSSQHLLSLINDLLDISKIEAGKVELNLEEFDLIASIEEILDSFSEIAKEKELYIKKDLPTKIMIYNDNRRVKQIIINLVSNAIKYTDRGGINISAKLLDNGTTEFSVSDTGIGIKEENAFRLFEPFQQIDPNLTKKIEGSGLGLYLTKKLILLMGGDIILNSTFGKGSVFTVVLPTKIREVQNEKNINS